MYFRSLETASASFVAKQNRVGDLGTKLTRLIVTRGYVYCFIKLFCFERFCSSILSF